VAGVPRVGEPDRGNDGESEESAEEDLPTDWGSIQSAMIDPSKLEKQSLTFMVL